MSASCQHCGTLHRHQPARCPRAGLPMNTPGRCGTRIDRYEVISLLGTGGFGSVYRARHVRTQAEVALKVLKPELTADALLLERFLREASTSATINSEYVVRVWDADVTVDRTAFIAMELLDGEDLKALMKRELVHPARAVELCSQVLQGLAAAHDQRVVHRDMKPANVFVTRRLDVSGREVERAQVLDFGISKMAGSAPLTREGVTMGTPSYMAWEQFTDARAVDARTDLYAVAVMLFELLAGEKPYDSDSIPGLMNKVRIGERLELRSLKPLLPVPLCAVVEKGLQKHRERRWSTAREFASALQQAAGLLEAAPPLPPRPPGPTEVLAAVDPAKDAGTVLKPAGPDDKTER